MTKNNTNEHTQIELFDESYNIFEVIQTAEDIRRKLKQANSNDLDEDEQKDILCKKCSSRAMTTCMIICKNYSCFSGGVL